MEWLLDRKNYVKKQYYNNIKNKEIKNVNTRFF